MQSVEETREQKAARLTAAIRAEAEAGDDPYDLMFRLIRVDVDLIPLEEHDEIVGLLLGKALSRENSGATLTETKLSLVADCLFWLADHTEIAGDGAISHTRSALVNAPELPEDEEDKIWLAALEFMAEITGAGAERFPLYEKAIIAAGMERGSTRVAARLAVPKHDTGLDKRELKQEREAVMGALSSLSQKERKIAGGIAGAFTDNPRQLADTAVEVAKAAEKRGTQL